MDRIKRIFRLVHLCLWVLLSFLVGWQLHSENHPYWRAITLGITGTAVYAFYGHFFLLTRFAGQQKNAAFYSQLAALLFTGPLVYLLFQLGRPEDLLDLVSAYMMMLISIVPLFMLLGWLARITETLVMNTVKKEQLEKQAAEAELTYLKSQINPHFLFNTLNNIHTLVYKQSPAAPGAVMQLASLMRYMIYESNAEKVPLQQEMTYLQDYIQLQQLRYKENPVAVLRVEGTVEGYELAPLLFIHLLENAYKHSPARLQAHALSLQLRVQEGRLVFTVQNPVGSVSANRLEQPGGFGLDNLRKRLSLLYPGLHSLEIGSTGNMFSVTLQLHGLQTQPHERKAQLLHH